MTVMQNRSNLANNEFTVPSHGLSDNEKDEMLKKIVMKNEDIAWRVLDGEVIIITPEDSVQHYINEVGSTIWGFADGKRTVQDIIDLMKEEYRENIEKNLVSPEDIENDVIIFLSELSSEEKKIISLENRE